MPSLSLNTYEAFVGNFGRDTGVTPLDVGAGLGESLSPEMRALLNFSEELVMPGVDASLRQQLSSERFVTPGGVVRFGEEFVAEFLASAFGDTLQHNNSAVEAETPGHSRIAEAEVIIGGMEASRLWEAMLQLRVSDSPAVVLTGNPSVYEQYILASLAA
jgi:hypothetical protein